MRFLVLLAEEDHFDRWAALEAPQRATVITAFEDFDAAVRAAGALVCGEALAHPDQARTVRPGAGRAVTAGPHAETAEQLGGFFLIDAPDLTTAVELAALLPAQYAVEVRPVIEVVP
ncbi:MAG: YciI family protein [Nocardioides sp.]